MITRKDVETRRGLTTQSTWTQNRHQSSRTLLCHVLQQACQEHRRSEGPVLDCTCPGSQRARQYRMRKDECIWTEGSSDHLTMKPHIKLMSLMKIVSEIAQPASRMPSSSKRHWANEMSIAGEPRIRIPLEGQLTCVQGPRWLGA